MNSRLILICVPLAGLCFSGCKESTIEGPAVPANSPRAAGPLEAGPPLPPEPSEAERKLAQQIQAMETRELELELRLEEEKLARTEADIARERALLAKEREAWRLEQELADARSAKSSGPRSLAVSARARGGSYDYQMFYDDLAPLGTWFDSPDYGYVWQPSVCVTDHNWRPYTLGSWAHCDQGWTWCSDEPFGWATYHYGRWAQVRGCGWVWVPGDQWAPNWVSWRKNDTYIGWCPLPPETVYHRDGAYGSTIDSDCGIHPGWYVFMPVKHFDRPVRNYCEARTTCLTIFATTVNITNIIIRPDRVECPGPRYDWIKDSVRRPVPRYTLAWEQDPRGDRRAHRMEKDKLHFFAPKVHAPWNAELRPSRHAALAGHEVVRAEGGLPDKLASRFRTEKKEREKAVENLKGGAKAIVERQHRLVVLEQSREALREQAAAKSAALPATPDNSTPRPGRPDRGGKTLSRTSPPETAGATAPRAEPVPETPQPPEPAPEQATPAKTRHDLNSRREQLAKLRAEREAASAAPVPAGRPAGDPDASEKETPSRMARLREDQARHQLEQQQAREEQTREQAVTEKQRTEAQAASRREVATKDKAKEDKHSALRAALEDKRRQQKEAEAAREETAARQGAIEQQRRDAEDSTRKETAARNEADAREMDKQAALRAALEEKRRQQQEAQNEQAKDQAATQRAAMEQQRREAAAAARTEAARNDDARRETDKQSALRAALEEKRRQQQESQNEHPREQAAAQRAAMEQQRRQADAEAKAEQQARQREAIEQQRAVIEQQRREAEASARAEQQARQREAMEQRSREAEASARDAVEQQRREAEASARAEQQALQREAMEQNRRAAEAQARAEQQQRQAEEQQRRQAEERAKEAAEQQRKQAEDRDRDEKRPGRR